MAYSADLTIDLIQIFCGLSRKKTTRYCWPSQEAILDLLKRFHGLEVSRRTLNRYLNDMEGRGYFKRIRRTKTDEQGRKVFTSTLYVLGRRAYRLAGRLARVFTGVSPGAWSSRNRAPDPTAPPGDPWLSPKEVKRGAALARSRL